MGKWSVVEAELSSKDEALMIRALENIVLDNVKLDDEGTRLVIGHCIEKLQNHDITVRSNAVAVIAKEIREDNTALVYVVDDLGKGLASPTLLDLKDSVSKGEIYTLLHKDLCYIIEQLQKRFPGKLMPSFKPVAQYLVQAAASKDIEVCNAACDYWCSLKSPKPVPQKYIQNWMKIVTPKLQKLVAALMKALEYQKEHIDYLHTKTRAQAKDFRPKTSSKEMEPYVSKRSNAGAALNTLFEVFQSDIIAVFKMNLLARMRGDDWLQVEAGTFALGLFTQALGTPTDMQDCYAEVVNKIIDNFKSPNPLLRAISCFAMQNFVNAKMKGVKNPFSKTIKGALHAILDESLEVQMMGMRCLGTILAFSQQDLQPHSQKILDAFLKADPVLFGEVREFYVECIGFFYGQMGPTLEPAQSEALFVPVMKEWNAINWEEQQNSDPTSVMLICQSLCMMAMMSKSDFSANNGPICEKAMPFLRKVVDSANGHSLKTMTTTGLMVSCLDLINAICQGQPEAVPALADRYALAPCVINILKIDKFDETVHQSAVAMYGHLCQNHYDGVQDSVGQVVQLMDRMLKSKSDLSRNAAWTLTQITNKVEEKLDALFLICNQLGEMFQILDGDATTVVNAALSLTNIGVKWKSSMLALFIKDDIFLHLCMLLKSEFDVDAEKLQLFQNVNQIYSGCIEKVNTHLWVYYCGAVAALDIQDKGLEEAIKNILKDVRNAVGNTVWNKINTQLGKQASIQLRKKYKLY